MGRKLAAPKLSRSLKMVSRVVLCDNDYECSTLFAVGLK